MPSELSLHANWRLLAEQQERDPTSHSMPVAANPAVRQTLGQGNRLGLLLRVADQFSVPAIIQTEAIAAKTSEIQIDGETANYLRIECLNEELNDAFAQVASQIIESIHAGGEVRETLISVAKNFRSLFSQPGNRLGREELIGLFGELCLLEQLVHHNTDAITSWMGANRETKDFINSHLMIEVKTTERLTQKRVHISSIDQLETSDDEELYLAMFQLQRTTHQGVSIATITRNLIDRLPDSDLFDQKLKAFGISRDDALELDEPEFRIHNQEIYKVDTGFPRIVRQTIDGGIPDGIESISYTVDLRECSDHRMSSEEAANLLQRFAEHG